jgi:hypothetical protein
MIYLIGGPPRCGKTTVARRLATRTGASVVPIDYLGSVVYHYLSDEERTRRFPLMEGSLNAMYARCPASDIIAHYQTIARTLWPAIQVFTHFALAHEQDVILEGYQVEPAFMEEFMWPQDTDQLDGRARSIHGQEMVQRGTGYALMHRGDGRIRTVFLFKQEVDGIATTLTTGTDARDWVRREFLAPETRRRIALMISQYGHYIREEAARCGLPAIAMDDDFAQGVDVAVGTLLGQPA